MVQKSVVQGSPSSQSCGPVHATVPLPPALPEPPELEPAAASPPENSAPPQALISRSEPRMADSATRTSLG